MTREPSAEACVRPSGIGLTIRLRLTKTPPGAGWAERGTLRHFASRSVHGDAVHSCRTGGKTEQPAETKQESSGISRDGANPTRVD